MEATRRARQTRPRSRVAHVVPGVHVLASYERRWLLDDVRAGVVLTALLIPAGIGYAQVAGLPPVTGLYATIVPLLVYAVFGPSRILVLGPDSALAPIIAAAVIPLAVGDSDRAVALAGLLAILVGAILLLGSVFHLGFVTDLLSKPIRVGYLNGIALVVVVGQIPKLLGFSVDADGVVGDLRGIAGGIVDGLIDPRSVGLGAGSLAVIMVARWIGLRVTGLVLAVIGPMVLVAAAGWRDDVPTVGALPTGLPAPALGGLEWGDVVSLVGPALGIALIAFADTAVLSRSFAGRHGESVSGTSEMRALGAANVATGLTGGFAMSASSSRTPVADQAGGRTQLTGVTGAIAVAVFMFVAPGATGLLPTASLAAVVIVAATSLVDVSVVGRLLRVDRVEGLLSLAAFVGVVGLGVLRGIVAAIGLSFVAFVNQAWRPYHAELGRLPGVRGYHDLSRHPEGERIPGVLILRFDAPLFFANGGMFDDFVRSMVAGADRDLHTVIVAAEAITDVDSTAVDELVELDEHLAERDVRLVLAEMKGPVKDQLSRYGLDGRFGPDRFAPTVGAAVDEVVGHERDDIGQPSDRRTGPSSGRRAADGPNSPDGGSASHG